MLSQLIRDPARRCASKGAATRLMSYRPDTGRLPLFERSPHLAPGKEQPAAQRVSDKHKTKDWSKEQIDDALKKNCMFTWGASDAIRESAPTVVKGEGAYFWDDTGKKYIDFSAGAVCTNLGNTIPQEIKDAANESMDKLGFVYGELCVTEARARFCSLLADVTPGDINGFLFASSGSEANEAAIRAARDYTGRFKIMSRARSYHGGTTTSLAATGDARTWSVANSAIGVVKIIDPFPFTFEWGLDEDTKTHNALCALHEQILTEGPHQIAAILLESITGANGWLLPKPEYMQGIRALCDKYGIMLICDEVMTGFGRTGEFYGFEHFDGVLPDMITFAKGTTSAYFPLSGVGMRDHIFDYFRKNPLGYGSTYSGHPLGMAFGEATIKYTIEQDIVGQVRQQAPFFASELQRLADKHPSIKAARSIGLAGGFDLAGKDGNFLMDMHKTHPGVASLKKTLRELGLITLIRGHFMHITPPLTISKEALQEGFDILDIAFTKLDAFIANEEVNVIMNYQTVNNKNKNKNKLMNKRQANAPKRRSSALYRSSPILRVVTSSGSSSSKEPIKLSARCFTKRISNAARRS